MSAGIKGLQLRNVNFGFKVDKTATAITAISTKPLFVVTGGIVAVTSIVGVVTTVFQGQANLIKLVATPTVGSVNDLSAAVDATGLAVGSLIGITGLTADNIIFSTGGGIANLRNPVLVNTGTIGLNTSASSTGAARWVITYVPVEDGSAVAAG